jgi:type II secretion system protein H
VRRRAGFSLIEMLAVVAIFALMAAFVAPNLGLLSRRALRNDAAALAATLELARQRSVVTAVPHRLTLDLEAGGWQLEWLAGGEEEPALVDAQGLPPIVMEAPPAAAHVYAPLPSRFGRFTPLDDEVFFAGVETAEGWIERGEAFIGFERDGTATYTVIVLTSEDGDTLELEVLPLADAVRVRDAEG